MSNSLMEQEIAQLTSGNTIYNRYRDQWHYLLVSYLGGDEYRQAGLLQRYQLETAQEYKHRLENTPLDNHCQSVVSVYTSFLFREPPKRDFGSQTNSREIEQFLKDADMDGRSLDGFMADVATWSSVFGHVFILMSKPDVGALTRADEIAQGVRPYVSLLTPLTVLDWSWQRRPNGRYELDYLRYVEDINGSIQTIREWTPEEIRTHTIDVEKREYQSETVYEVNGLGRIPAVIAYNGRSMVRGLGVSDIGDIADAQRLAYNMMSEIHQSAVLDSHPSLVTTPDAQIGTGAGSIIQISDTMDPGLKPYLLEYSGASISNMLSTIQHLTDSIDKMANTGSIRSTEARRLSGVAQEQEFELLNSRLAEKADQMELAEEGIWRLWSLYQNTNYDITVEYPGSFNIRDTGNEFTQLKMAKETATDPVVSEIIDRKIIELLGEEADEYIPDMEEMQPTTPANRQQHIQEMIMSGYEDVEILNLHPEISQTDIDQARQALLT